jgi:2-isopropylmalate synthase
LKDRATYEIIQPEDVGFVGTGLVLGKHSGRHAFRARLKALGIELTETEFDKAFARFKDVADKKKQVFDEDLVAIAEDEAKVIKAVWRLVNLKIASSMNSDPKVEVVLESKGKKYARVSSGDGPVDACYKAIDSLTKMKGELMDYSIQSVSRGKDAIGEATIKVKLNGTSVIAHGADTDILVASAKAYINAVNKVAAQE